MDNQSVLDKAVNQLDNNNIFLFIVIPILIPFITSALHIKPLSVIILLAVGIIIYLIYAERRIIQQDKTQQLNATVSGLNVSNLGSYSKNTQQMHMDLIDFINSIKKYETYNPEVYQSLIKAFDKYSELYELISNDTINDPNELSGITRNILNNFNTLKHSIPSSEINNWQTSMTTLKALLNQYNKKAGHIVPTVKPANYFDLNGDDGQYYVY